MQVIADLQVHSKYSRAVSLKMDLREIAKFAMIKGIQLMATGDWTHPLWLKEIKSKLEEKSAGLFGLRTPVPLGEGVPAAASQPLFLLSGEVSSIYTQGGKVRRIHNLIFSPSFEACERINKELVNCGCNLMADGRPIIGLSSIELVEIVFSVDERCLIIPAHAWTPWFSLYGSRSGFDSLEECFGSYAKNIYAIETGLSSSPSMNWRVKELDTRTILSFSDAHSGIKIGREATVFEILNPKSQILKKNDGEFCYQDVADAIKQNPNGRCKIAYTIEFYPEEGKYHFNGHRNCGIVFSPSETHDKGTICPVCGKQLTLGVAQRVEELAGREIEELELEKEGQFIRSKKFSKRPSFIMTVPLYEIVGQSLEVSFSSQRAMNVYLSLCERLGGEFAVLLTEPLSNIEKVGGREISTSIDKVRRGDITIKSGYDGVFGTVLLDSEKSAGSNKQLDLFA